jgi:hypothetical protein
MKRLLLLLALLPTLNLAAAENVQLHPGETNYLRFDEKGKKLKLLEVSKEKDASAQLVISLSEKDKDGTTILKLESALHQTIVYKATIYSRVFKRHMPLNVYPIIGGKMGTVSVPPFVDEITLKDFRFEPATLIEKEKER